MVDCPLPPSHSDVTTDSAAAAHSMTHSCAPDGKKESELYNMIGFSAETFLFKGKLELARLSLINIHV